MRLLYLFLAIAACGGAVDDTGSDGGQNGFGMPTLEVTVNGSHFGPGAPEAGSFVDLVNQYDTNGDLTRSSLQIVASSGAAGASCGIAADRYGDFVTSFGVGQYTLSGAGSGGTPDGTAVPVGQPTVSVAQGSFSCAGSACGDTAITLSAIDQAHAEGFFAGTLSGADVVCAFYLPMRNFHP